MTLSHENNTRNGLPGQNYTKMRYYTCSWLHLLNNHSWPWYIWRPFCFLPWQCPFGLEDDLGSPKKYHKGIFQTKSNEKEVLHMFLALFVKKGIFAYLTLKLTFWPWRWPYIIKIIQEMDCPVKITWKWGITLVPGFICWKKHIWPWNIWRPFCFCP